MERLVVEPGHSLEEERDRIDETRSLEIEEMEGPRGKGAAPGSRDHEATFRVQSHGESATWIADHSLHPTRGRVPETQLTRGVGGQETIRPRSRVDGGLPVVSAQDARGSAQSVEPLLQELSRLDREEPLAGRVDVEVGLPGS